MLSKLNICLICLSLASWQNNKKRKFHLLIKKKLAVKDFYGQSPWNIADCFTLRVSDIVSSMAKKSAQDLLPFPQNLTIVHFIWYSTKAKLSELSPRLLWTNWYMHYLINSILVIGIILYVLSKSIFSFADPANQLCRSSILIRRNEYSRFTVHCDVKCKYSLFHIDHTCLG